MKIQTAASLLLHVAATKSYNSPTPLHPLLLSPLYKTFPIYLEYSRPLTFSPQCTVHSYVAPRYVMLLRIEMCMHHYTRTLIVIFLYGFVNNTTL
jgi:hypothetical protein